MDLSLSGKHALVCGGAKGIGRACAFEIAALGAGVTILARDEDAMRKAVAELPAKGGAKHGHAVADLSRPDALRPVIDQILKERGGVHVLVNNTGGPPSGPMLDATLEQLRGAFDSLLASAHVLTQAAAPGMKKAQYGRVINIASTSVKEPIAGLGLSNSVRAAVANWAKTLSQELGPFGITVNNVLPGFTDTDRLRQLFDARATRTSRPADEHAKDAVSRVPAGRFGRPEEVGAAVAFLASPAAGYINGVNLPVDGGRLACL